MAIDVVHDTQEVFRTILHCMSRPGTIKSIEEVGKPVRQFGYCQNSTIVTAITLLDAEVNFHVISENAAAIEDYLSAFTLSKVADVHIADYIFIMKDAKNQNISDILNKAKKGTLLNPHQSATIIVETDALSNGNDLLLEGPGIQNTKNVKIDGSEFWLVERAEVNREYPLGVDMVLIDPESNMMCLPRTTMISDCEVS